MPPPIPLQHDVQTGNRSAEKTLIEVHTLEIQLERQRFKRWYNVFEIKIVNTNDFHKQIPIRGTLTTFTLTLTLTLTTFTTFITFITCIT